MSERYYYDLDRRRRVAAALGGGAPAWVLRGGGIAANLDIDFVNDLAWNSGATPTIASLLSCTRATPADATYTNVAGLISYVAANTLRYGNNGLLIEESRANLALQASDFTNASWTKSNMTTAKTATGPDGVVNSASTLTATAGNATALQAITSASAARITSVYIRRRTGTGNIDVTQDNGSTWATKAITSSWARYEIASVTSTNPTVGIRIVTSGDAVDVFIFQHELGAFITSPIPTTTGSVTRAADVVAFSNVAWIGSAANSLYAQFMQPVATADFNAISYLWDGGFTNTFNQYVNNSGSYRSFSSGGGGDAGDANTGNSTTAGVVQKGFSAIDTADLTVILNGGTPVQDTTVTRPSGMNAAWLGSANGGSNQFLNGYLQRLAAWQSRVGNAAGQTLTA